MQTGILCPKCRYARRATDTAPAWQCPACGVAYNKFQAGVAQVKAKAKQVVVPPKAGEAAPRFTLDGSVWALLAANVLALAIALHQHWPLAELMLLYWGQSVVIGVSYMLRILALEKFSTENFTINHRPVEPTPATKWKVAGFFTFHYGFFHVIYLVFILVGPGQSVSLDLWFWVCTAAFALNHIWSYRYNRDLDRQGTPNIGTLMFTPYLRIIPMHVTIITGGLMGSGGGLLLFGGLKTVADVLMHVVEHRRIKKVATT